SFHRDGSGRQHHRNLHNQHQRGGRIHTGHHLRVLWRHEHIGFAHRDASASSNGFFADVEPYARYWRNAIVHRYGDAERASSRRWRASYAFQQQRSGQRSFQRDGSGRQHHRHLHNQHQRGGRIHPGHHLRVLWRHEHIGFAHRDASASSNGFFADVEPYDCRWRRAIFYGYGDADRASSRRRRASYACQQQRGGKRSFQRAGSGRQQQRSLHGERVNSSHINFCHHLGFV